MLVKDKKKGDRHRLGKLQTRSRFGVCEKRGGGKEDWVGRASDHTAALRKSWPGHEGGSGQRVTLLLAGMACL